MSEEKTEEGVFAEGQVLGERFVVERQLQETRGDKETYLVREEASSKPFAVRVLRSEGLAEDDEEREYANLRELVKESSALKHKALIRVYGLGREEDVHFIIAEHVEANSLAARLEKRRARGQAFSAKVVFNIITHVSGVLQKLHESGAHGSLSLERVLLTSQSKVKVDHPLFGMLGRDRELGESLPELAACVAPELTEGEVTVGGDLYALAMMTTMLMSADPFEAAPEARALEVAAGVGRGFKALIEEALAEDPAARLDNVIAFRDRLRDVIEGDSEPAPAEQEASDSEQEANTPAQEDASGENPSAGDGDAARSGDAAIDVEEAESAAGEEAESDAGEEAGSDAGEEAASDVGSDVSEEVNSDADEDVSGEADDGDGGDEEDDPFARAAKILGSRGGQGLVSVSTEARSETKGDLRYLVSKDGLDFGPYSRAQVIEQLHSDEINEYSLVLDRKTQERMTLQSMPVFAREVQKYIPVREERRRQEEERRAAVVDTAVTTVKRTVIAGIVLGVLVGLGFMVYWFVFRPQPMPLDPKQELFVDLGAKYRMLPPPKEFAQIKVDDLAALLNEGASGGGKARGNWKKRLARKGRAGKKGGAGGAESDENISYLDMSDNGGSKKILTDSDISATVRGYMGGISACLRQEKKRNPSFKGVTVQFFVRPSGKTGGVKLVEGQYNSGPLGGCLKSKFQAIRFPAHGGLNKGVRYPFYFR